jgi:2'-5' RNA ligase
MHRRLFLAIDLPKRACWQLGRLVAEAPRGVRPVRQGQLHLTLHFLGDVDDEDREALCRRLGDVRQEPFTIAIRGTGVFPPRGRPSVLWAGVAASPPLAELQAAVGRAIDSCDLEVERRPYVPHVTLARLTPAAPRDWTARMLADTGGLALDGLPVDRFQLYHSRRRDGASEHVVEATFPLAGNEGSE